MIQRDEGHILNVCSISGLAGMPELSAYCSSKFAMVGFNEVLRAELMRAGSRVKTTIVCPYYIRIGMYDPISSPPRYLPVLEPQWACRRILDALRQEEDAVVLPWKLNPLLALKWLLPTRVSDWAWAKLTI
jgi:all-trans-retinol dehydrogenase (NAD+)